MSLATRCPHCNTLFKVSTGQLQLHQGQVRCGQCKQVFSGIENLTAADSQVWQTMQLQVPAPGSPEEKTPDSALFSEASASAGAGLFKPERSAAVRRASVALGLLLLLQTAWWQRTTLAAQVPPVAQVLANSSVVIQHLFSLPASAAVQVQGSGLQALDEHNVRLDVTLRNSATLPAAWPHLRVDLLDAQGLVLATRSVSPGDYQQRDANTASQAPPIPPGQTVELLAYLNLQTLNTQLPEAAATGFRVSLFDRGPPRP
ncbi:zinc-ribbon and DUF3426 domain-containing protein [Limnobacter sp.]|uniref:zinc-ribbon and DUF3426 domain-containing protein n=1 Tax=Limnobacter sp. TaxID=2003368 RepID=UPI00351719BF